REDGRERDFVGYGRRPPKVAWPNGARVVVSFVVNYEEGAERNVLDGDERNEGGGEIRYVMPPGVRDLAVEANVEYGSRVGGWRRRAASSTTRTPTTTSCRTTCRCSAGPGWSCRTPPTPTTAGTRARRGS